MKSEELRKIIIEDIYLKNWITDSYVFENFSKTWIWNNDGSVSVDGSIFIGHEKFSKLPVKFKKVSGYFEIQNCAYLSDLEGCPEEIEGLFCYTGYIENLDYCPKIIGRDFYWYCKNKRFTEKDVRKKCRVSGKIEI